MPLEKQAQTGDSSEDQYDAILGTMMASARGRWFLTEYARRNRSADTVAVLAAIDRIGAHLRGEELPPHAPEYLQLGLMAMAGLVAAVETDLTALSSEPGTSPRAIRVVTTLRDLGDCIQVMLDGFKPAETKESPAPAPPLPAATLTLVENPAAASAENLAPQPAPLPEPAVDIEAATTAASEPVAAMPDLNYETDFVPFEFDAPEEMVAAADLPQVALPQVEPLGPGPAAVPAETAPHPLAELRALTRAERIALFS